MEKEILLLKEEVLALRQQIESLNKKLENLNLNLIQKELSGAEKNGVVIVKPIIVEPMEYLSVESHFRVDTATDVNRCPEFLFCREVANATSSWSQNFPRAGKTSISVNGDSFTLVKIMAAYFIGKVYSHCSI